MRGSWRTLLLTLLAAAACAARGDAAAGQAPAAAPPPAASASPAPARDIEDFVPTERLKADDAVSFPTDI